MAAPDLAGVAWHQLLAEQLEHAGFDDAGLPLAAAIAAEMPLDLASAPVANLLAERHAVLAGIYDGIAAGLTEGA